MTRNTGSRIVFTVCLISIFLIYIIVTDIISRRKIAYEELYVSQFLLPVESTNVGPVAVDEMKIRINNKSNEINVNLSKRLPDYIVDSNETAPDSSIEGDQTIYKVVYSKISGKNTHRNVFVDMKDINKYTGNIFFIETRCATERMAVHFKSYKGLVLSARQCCSIESTARMNPNHNVYLFHSCFLDEDFFKHSPEFVNELFKYPNIYVVRLNIENIVLDSPVEELWERNLLEKSNYPVEHASDLLRLVLLWKFGGTYSDMDTVTIRPLNKLGTNWAGMQDNETIANGVINFEPEGSGHDMLRTALEYTNTHYDPSNWSTNGPLLITPIILRECAAQTVTEAQKYCNGSFTVYNNSVFYPVDFKDAKDFFIDSLGEELVQFVKTMAYSVHIWNKMSHNLVVNVGSSQAYALLAEEYCPQVYRNCGLVF